MQENWSLPCSHSDTWEKKSESYGSTDNTRTWPPVLQFQTAMTQLPVLEGESEQKYLGGIFLKLERNDYMFRASLRGECSVCGTRSDVIMCILKNLRAPSASEEAANTLSSLCQEVLNIHWCVHLLCPLTVQRHSAWITCLNGTEREKNFWPDIKRNALKEMLRKSDAKIIWEICHITYSAQPIFTLPSNLLSKCLFSFAPFFSLLYICNLKQETIAWQRISCCIMKNTITNSSQENAPFSNCLIEKKAMGNKIFTPHILASDPEEKNIMARNFLQSRKKIMFMYCMEKSKLSFLISYSEPGQFFRLNGMILK